jgi:hypothetical protein
VSGLCGPPTMQTNNTDYDDWLDLRDNRSGKPDADTTTLTPTTDINAAFDQVAALFEAYPEPPKSEKMTMKAKRNKKSARK